MKASDKESIIERQKIDCNCNDCTFMVRDIERRKEFDKLHRKISGYKIRKGMKKYLAFYGSNYYPSGGMDDFIGDFDSKEDAIDFVIKQHEKENPNDTEWEYHWGNVYDTENRIQVFNK